MSAPSGRSKRSRAKRDTAFHEAGHAVAAERLGVRVARASIVPTSSTLGTVHHGRVPEPELAIVTSYAGPLAMAKHLGHRLPFAAGTGRPPALAVVAGGGRDLANARRAGRLGDQFADAAERRAYLRWLWERARALVNHNWPEIEAVAAALLKRRTLTGTQVRRELAALDVDPPDFDSEDDEGVAA